MKLQINVPVSGLDLASLLQGEKGFSSAKQGQELRHGSEGWSLHRLWPNANWPVIQEQPTANLDRNPGWSRD